RAPDELRPLVGRECHRVSLRAGAGDCWVGRPPDSHGLAAHPRHPLLMLGIFDHGLARRGRTTRASAYNRDAHSDGPGTRAADGHWASAPRATTTGWAPRRR